MRALSRPVLLLLLLALATVPALAAPDAEPAPDPAAAEAAEVEAPACAAESEPEPLFAPVFAAAADGACNPIECDRSCIRKPNCFAGMCNLQGYCICLCMHD